MKRKLLLASVLLFFVGAITAQTLNLNALNKNQIMSMFSGKTMRVGPAAYHGKKLETDTILVYFAPDGTTAGKWVKVLPGNVPQTDKGTWTVSNDGQVCVKWEAWGSSYCMYFYDLKNNLLMVSTDQSEALLIPKSSFSSGNTIA